MSYSDIEMVIASQLAYLDISSAAVDSGEYTVEELLKIEGESATGGKKELIEYIQKLMNQNAVGARCGDWIIRDIRNDQKISGMYACMLDTGDGGAVIAFRGSESITNPDNLVKDWLLSDLGLLNSSLTPQQAAAEQYIRDIERKYGDRYQSYGLTGHSLGGNLAEHAAITASDSMRDKFGRCLSLDGPGYSAKYLTAHAGDIEKSKGLIDHYRWSIVGTFFNPVPGSNYQTVEADTPDGHGILNIFCRHDTRNLSSHYDENGNLIPGGEDWLSYSTKGITSMIDAKVFIQSGSMGLALLHNLADVTLDELGKLWEDWQNYFTSGGRAEFSVHAAALRGNMEQIENTERIVREVCGEVENVRRTLSMHSLATGYYKYRLWRTENSMETLSRRLHTYADKGRYCVQSYLTYDREAAGKY